MTLAAACAGWLLAGVALWRWRLWRRRCRDLWTHHEHTLRELLGRVERSDRPGIVREGGHFVRLSHQRTTEP